MALLVKNGNVVQEQGIEVLDIKIDNGIITEIGQSMLASTGDTVIEASGKYVLPGLIDAHVHYKMGIGNVYTIDNFESGSRAALFGGVTTVVDYADPLSGKSLADSLRYRIGEAKGASFVDYTFHMVIGHDTEVTSDVLKELREIGINSLKLFTIYGERLSYEKIEAIIALCQEAGMVVTVHAEDADIVEEQVESLKQEGNVAPRFHGVSRPARAEVLAVEKLIEMAKKYKTHVHVVHVSTGEAAERIKEAKKAGIPISGETCPHYLLLTDDVYAKEDAQLFVMQPPLRSKEDVKTLWKNVEEGTFSFFTTDHCAYCEGQKYNSNTFYETNGGIPGTETLFPVLYTEGVGKKHLSLEKLVNMLSKHPAQTFGLYPQKGTIQVGSDADLVLFDPNRRLTVDKELIHSAAQYSTFEGMKLQGYPVMTILRGQVMCRDGEFVQGEPIGRFVEAIR